MLCYECQQARDEVVCSFVTSCDACHKGHDVKHLHVVGCVVVCETCKAVCPACGDVCLEHVMQFFDGELYCFGCAEDLKRRDFYATMCDGCGKYVHRNEAVAGPEKEYFCQLCLDVLLYEPLTPE